MMSFSEEHASSFENRLYKGKDWVEQYLHNFHKNPGSLKKKEKYYWKDTGWLSKYLSGLKASPIIV